MTSGHPVDRRERAVRSLVVRCADWAVAAAGVASGEPAVVLHANRVVAASAAARQQGVEVGLRRREAQARCPDARVLGTDHAREARAFEPVVARLEALTPRIEVLVPGRATFATQGPSRYFGGDEALAALVLGVTEEALLALGLDTQVTVGVADGAFAAGLAAADPVSRDNGRDMPRPVSREGAQRRRDGPVAGVRVVAPGASPAFLAPRPVATLAPLLEGGPELVDVWSRLGLASLGELARLPVADVLARFGVSGALGHRLAAGLDVRPLDARRPAPEYTMAAELDPPAERVDAAAFLAKSLAERLHQRLAADGLACTRIVIGAETEHGERLERTWRHEGTLTAAAIAERARWQLDGWLSGSAAHRPTAGISRLVLAPDDVVPARGRQLGFWGGEARVDDRVVKALARVQALVGVEAVRVPERRGGRGPDEQVTTVPVASVDLSGGRPLARPGAVTDPWPGQVPAPAPATVHVPPASAEVLDRAGQPVGVTGRGTATGAPARLAVTGAGGRPGTGWQPVQAWAGPWPVEERWWDPEAHRRRARFQVVTRAGSAYLLSVEGGRWWVDASYT